MTDTLAALLLRLSEGGRPALLWGRVARPYFGAAFDRMLAAGVLVEGPPAEEWSACADCDCGFGLRPIQRIDGRIVAACPIDASSDTVLDEDDLRGFRVDPERLFGLISAASGFQEPLELLAPYVWRIGRLASGRSVVVAISVRDLDHPGTVLLLKSAAGGASVTVAAPDPGPDIRLRFLEAGIDLVELRAALKPNSTGIDVFDLAMLEPVGVEPRLTIDRRARRSSLDGRSVRLSDQLFALLLFLAERALDSPETVEFRVIEDHVWDSGVHRISSGIREPVRALRDALAVGAADGKAARALIENTRNPNGYRLGLPASEIIIAD